MTHHDMFSTNDLEKFAEYMGLDGADADLFYESYYQLDADDEDFLIEDHRVAKGYTFS